MATEDAVEGAIPAISQEEERISVASQRQLIWWRFKKHRLAVISGVIVLGFYLIAFGADFIATNDPSVTSANLSLVFITVPVPA